MRACAHVCMCVCIGSVTTTRACAPMPGSWNRRRDAIESRGRSQVDGIQLGQGHGNQSTGCSEVAGESCITDSSSGCAPMPGCWNRRRGADESRGYIQIDGMQRGQGHGVLFTGCNEVAGVTFIMYLSSGCAPMPGCRNMRRDAVELRECSQVDGIHLGQGHEV